MAYHSNTALLGEVTAALDIPSPAGAPFTDDPKHIVITEEGGDRRVTVTDSGSGVTAAVNGTMNGAV